MTAERIPVFWGTGEGRFQVGTARIEGNTAILRLRDKNLLGWVEKGGISNISVGFPEQFTEEDAVV